MTRRQRAKNLTSALIGKLSRRQVFAVLTLLILVGGFLVYTDDIDFTTDTVTTEAGQETPEVTQPDVNDSENRTNKNGSAENQTPDGNTTSSGNTTG